jgi:hypothetical protein
MKETDHAIPEKLVILAYWPHRQTDEPNIGYGLYQGVGTIFSLMTRAFSMFFEPKVRPAIRPLLRIVPFLAIGLILAILTQRVHKYNGYYQIDDQGRPVHFLDSTPPASIKGRFGVTRKKFLEQIKYG